MTALLCLLVGLAQAHPAPTSAVFLDVGGDAIGVTLELPRDQLAMALSGTPDPEAPLPADAALGQYALDHLQVEADGRLLDETPGDVAWEERDGAATLVVQAALIVPAGADLATLTLRDDGIIHTVASHKTVVYLRHDVAMGQVGATRMLGTLKRGQTSLTIDRNGASAARGLTASVALGANHIAEGTDHLLFLLCLLLVAPLRATAGQWSPVAAFRPALLRIASVVTAFTVGHSLTLAIAAWGLLRAPGAVVEPLIAASIAVSAVHAARPIFPGREAWVAGGFGLVHGLGFAEALAGLGFDPGGLLMALLGFNIGVEAAQLAVVVAAAPILALVAGADPQLRVGAAGLAFVAAWGWIGERVWGLANPLGAALDAAVAHPLVLYAAVGVIAVVARVAGPFAMRAPVRSEG